MNHDDEPDDDEMVQFARWNRQPGDPAYDVTAPTRWQGPSRWPTREQIREMAERPVDPGYFVIDPASWQELRKVAVEAYETFHTLQDALDFLDPDKPPADPKDRALWLRQHRNTGPDHDTTKQRRTKSPKHTRRFR